MLKKHQGLVPGVPGGSAGPAAKYLLKIGTYLGKYLHVNPATYKYLHVFDKGFDTYCERFTALCPLHIKTLLNTCYFYPPASTKIILYTRAFSDEMQRLKFTYGQTFLN